MENSLLEMNYRQIQAQKEYTNLITKRASDLCLSIIKKYPSRLIIKNNDFTREYFFMNKWQTLSELSDWIYNQFFQMKELENIMIKELRIK